MQIMHEIGYTHTCLYMCKVKLTNRYIATHYTHTKVFMAVFIIYIYIYIYIYIAMHHTHTYIYIYIDISLLYIYINLLTIIVKIQRLILHSFQKRFLYFE